MELISREAVINAIEKTKSARTDDNEVYVAKVNLLMKIDALSPIQPEIIRCKDCKYARLTDDGSCKYCDIWFPDEAEYMDGDYYCASAERKSNG